MNKIIEWAMLEAPFVVTVAAIFLISCAIVCAIMAVIALAVFGYGWLAVAVGLGIPAWVILAAYRKRGGDK